MDSTHFFKKGIADHESIYQKFSKHSKSLAVYRVLAFVGEIILFVYLINIRELSWALGSLAIFLFIFALLVKRYNRTVFKRDQQNFLVSINKDELNRLNGKFEQGSDGSEYLRQDHPYARDIDIFGNTSLFTLINRTSTFPGKDLLAKRLLGDAIVKDLPQYQQSVREMTTHPNFIQNYRALGMHIKSEENDYNAFIDWVNSPKVLLNRPIIKTLLWLLPSLFVIALSTAFFFDLSYYISLPFVAINAYFLASYHKHTSKVVEQTSASVRLLKTYIHHLDLIDNHEFESSYLQSLIKAFSRNGQSARQDINELRSLLDHLQTRTNDLHILINIPLILDLQWLVRLEKWQTQNGKTIEQWIATFAEIEVIISLAGLSFAEADWVYPKIVDQPYKFQSTNLGHPLLNREERVTNNFNLEGRGQLVLLTGPNMAGKSTFLRTIATNIIMAKIGGAVCASALTLSNDYQIFTSMRTEDDLSESISSFYAELTRIKQLLTTVDSEKNVMFFLDEILKGTNSEDRHKGAEALIRQLISLGVTGFVSTHDIALGQLTSELEGVANFSFESTINDENISFDYKLKEGICTSFNACALMRNMGINV